MSIVSLVIHTRTLPSLHGHVERTVNVTPGMAHNLLDRSLLLQILERLAGQRAIDFQTIDKDGDGDEAVGLDIFLEFVGDGLVENDGVLCLVLDCNRESDVSDPL